jgi:hypothetical protein
VFGVIGLELPIGSLTINVAFAPQFQTSERKMRFPESCRSTRLIRDRIVIDGPVGIGRVHPIARLKAFEKFTCPENRQVSEMSTNGARTDARRHSDCTKLALAVEATSRPPPRSPPGRTRCIWM